MRIWNRFWKAVSHLLIQTSEPSVTQKSDRSGHHYFQVYDPMTRKYGEFSSEQEIRAWLEQRYYHS
jgi:Sec7-like guanine-nucleotide exchange factor